MACDLYAHCAVCTCLWRVFCTSVVCLLHMPVACLLHTGTVMDMSSLALFWFPESVQDIFLSFSLLLLLLGVGVGVRQGFSE